jgi:hypothetical protein
MGVRTNLLGITPSSTHISAAQGEGHGSPAMLLQTLELHAQDMIAILNQLVKDATAGNGSDPNISTLNAQITALS